MPQPIAVGTCPASPAGNGARPVSLSRSPPSITVRNSFEDSNDIAARPLR